MGYLPLRGKSAAAVTRKAECAAPAIPRLPGRRPGAETAAGEWAAAEEWEKFARQPVVPGAKCYGFLKGRASDLRFTEVAGSREMIG